MGRRRGANLKVDYYDNRALQMGGDPRRSDGFPVGFGYVYFNDGSRVAWTDDRGPYYCTTPWGEVGTKHLLLAYSYLDDLHLFRAVDPPAAAAEPPEGWQRHLADAHGVSDTPDEHGHDTYAQLHAALYPDAEWCDVYRVAEPADG